MLDVPRRNDKRRRRRAGGRRAGVPISLELQNRRGTVRLFEDHDASERPGGLSDQKYADVIAAMFQAGGFPAGLGELSSDPQGDGGHRDH